MASGGPSPVGRALLTISAGVCAWLGCARPEVPDPRTVAQRFADAATRGDANAIHAMLTERAQTEYGRSGTERLVRDSRAELRRLGQALRSGQLKWQTRAQVRFPDGELATLPVEDGEFKIESASGLPAGAHTPAQALDQLRLALARRSYPGLIRVLSAETRSNVENDLRSLVKGLENPESLDVKLLGDSADVTIPGGHSVRLKRESGLWRVEDFE